MLAVEPAGELREIRRAIDAATSSVIGTTADGEASSRWIPHVTVGYSTSEQSAGPIVEALGTSVSERRLVVEVLSLVIQ
jgi:hypothetical protein